MNSQNLVENRRLLGQKCVSDFKTATETVFRVENFAWIDIILIFFQESRLCGIAIQTDGKIDHLLNELIVFEDGLGFKNISFDKFHLNLI